MIFLVAALIMIGADAVAMIHQHHVNHECKQQETRCSQQSQQQ